MRTFKIAVASVVAMCAAAAGAAAGTITFRSPDDAMRQGISAFNGGFYELALPALEALEPAKPAVARFYIARIYADNEGSYTDHPKAFAMFKKLADELRDVDPDDEDLAPIAAKSLTALSMYLRRGIPDAGIRADVIGSDRALQLAALTFNDEDAQFELAKVFLRGEGPDITLGGIDVDDRDSKIENGQHWLSRLSRRGHPGAQAFLADLMWRGKYVAKDQITALNLIDVAAANAPASERVWIEDIYQNIFCNAGEGVREQATGRVAEWHERYGRRPVTRSDKSGLQTLAAQPVRTCSNGEMVRPIGQNPVPGVVSAAPPVPNLGVPASSPLPPATGPAAPAVGFAPR